MLGPHPHPRTPYFPQKMCNVFSFFFLRLLYLRKLLLFFSASLTCIDLLFHMPKGRVDQNVALMQRCVAQTDRSLMTGGFVAEVFVRRSVVYFLSNAVQVYKKKGGVGGWIGVWCGGGRVLCVFIYMYAVCSVVLPSNPNFIC